MRLARVRGAGECDAGDESSTICAPQCDAGTTDGTRSMMRWHGGRRLRAVGATTEGATTHDALACVGTTARHDAQWLGTTDGAVADPVPAVVEADGSAYAVLTWFEVDCVLARAKSHRQQPGEAVCQHVLDLQRGGETDRDWPRGAMQSYTCRDDMFEGLHTHRQCSHSRRGRYDSVEDCWHSLDRARLSKRRPKRTSSSLDFLR